MEDIIRLDRVSIFRDQLSFLIPRDWVEGESEEVDHYLYHAPNTDSGWLRVSLITLRLEKETPADRLHRLHLKWRSEDQNNVFIEERTNNVIRVHEKDSEEDDLMRLYYWHVANLVEPNSVQEAIFSFTVLRDRIHDPRTLHIVKVVGELVTQAQFSPANFVN